MGLVSLKQKVQEVCRGELEARPGLTPCLAEAYPYADILVSPAVDELQEGVAYLVSPVFRYRTEDYDLARLAG